MYEANGKASRGTCASTPSPASSPLTPGLDGPPPEPRFAEYDKQSATLDSIGAWSVVQPNPNPPPATDDHSHRFGPEMRSLSNKYSTMHLDQTNADDVDYSELDEAILRGRSTTLSNIFAIPNPSYRFAAGMDSTTLPGPISPASNSTFSMLSRHGSVSITNSNRTVSPLGLPLNANPIHQSVSLDNRFTSALDLMHPPTGSNHVPHAPIRRFSEFSAEPNSCLALASYSMAPHFASSNDTTDAINTSGASHGATGRPTFVTSSTTTSNASISNARCEGSAHHQPAASTRYGSFSYHLPTMREEESPSAPLSPPTFADSVLMRNMGFSAMPLPPSGGSAGGGGGPDDSSHFLSNEMASPLGMRDSDPGPGRPQVAAEALPDRDVGAGGSYLPLRVKSLKNLRQTSVDTRGDYEYMSAAEDHVDSSFFERAAEPQSSMSLNQLAGLGRRHSLSTSNLSMPTSAIHSQVDSGNASEYSVYPPFVHPSNVPYVHGFAPTMRSYGTQPGQYPSQQYHPFALGSAPIARVASGPSVNNGPMQHVGPGMYSAHMLGAMAPHQYPYMNHLGYQAQYHQYPQMALGPAHFTEQPPSLTQTVPIQVAITTQQQQQQQYMLHQQHHMRRASHPAISSIGAASPAPPSSGTAHSGPHPLPNPATTITPNMPFADMGKGLTFGSLPKSTRVFVVQFKGKRCDLYFAPSKGMESKIVPTLAPSTAPPHGAAAIKSSGAGYEPGTYVLVEADRGVDLGMIKEELLTAESILSFSSSIPGVVCADHPASADPDSTAEHSGPRGLKPASAGDSQTSSKDVFVKRIFRVADQREVDDMMNKVVDEQKALSMCQDKVQQRKLSMYVADAEFQFDRRKLTFYFTADRRVDFRELVRELFKHFKTRIWMCQLTH